MPIEVQTSDLFNPAPKIDQPGKRLWTFYGPNLQFRNHYGYLHMMGYDDKPTEAFRPKLVRYKAKIYPVNQVYSAWPGIEIDGQTALMQPRMGDIVKVWTAHRADPAGKYPALAKIIDDTGDGVPEVNRPEEINALIAAISQMLSDIKYPMEGKRVVWVMDDRVYRSGTGYRVVEKHPWEASPYANVHKYSHLCPCQLARFDWCGGVLDPGTEERVGGPGGGDASPDHRCAAVPRPHEAAGTLPLLPGPRRSMPLQPLHSRQTALWGRRPERSGGACLGGLGQGLPAQDPLGRLGLLP